MYHFSKQSEEKLESCHTDLIRLFNEVIKYRDCTILCGRREKAEQDRLFKEGKSQVQYPNSKHSRFPSRAVDAVPYPIDWDNIPRFREFGGFVLGMAAAMKIPVEWGGQWKNFKDYPHYQLK